HDGFMDVVIHPKYAENKYIYFSYSKTDPKGPYDDFTWNGTEKRPIGKRDSAMVALVRARYELGSHQLTDVKEVFVADATGQGSSNSKMVFDRSGKIIITVGMATRHGVGAPEDAQNPANHAGKILRLNDDGTVPQDNPFVGKAGYRPEIYALGIRNALG